MELLPTFPQKRFALDFHEVVLFPVVKGPRFGDFRLPASTLYELHRFILISAVPWIPLNDTCSVVTQ